ncbi:MAG: carboxypeptidase regulatory-like domain-containing protein, partial [Candidatus Solibacter usitatus]|nr:carboxypeptidase regulatory-like domain-containing protein [Candidatus Solibacter usitatus]
MRLSKISLTFCLLLVLVWPVAGQQLTQISGTVTDPSGAVVPNTVLILESTERGQRRETKSDTAGRYIFPQVQPGTHKLTAKASGFAEMVYNALELRVNTPATVNVTFEKVGSLAETISVSAEAAQINTTDSSIGNAIGSKPILELPSFARNVAGLLALQPGVNEFGNVNGGKADQGNVTLDGVDVNDQMERSAFTSVLRVTLDSTQEFRTTTSNANADQGRSSGAQVSLVTKSGSNDLHGSAYWYHRNTATAANDFFLNTSGVKIPKLLINIPGGSLGGPIKKNKIFLFGNWEQRQNRSAANVSRVVPSLNLRQGTVSYRTSAGAVETLNAQDIRTRIDPAGIGVNQAVLAIFQSYPTPNDTSLGDGLNFQGYRFTAPIASHFTTYVSRMDYQIDSRQNFFFRGQLQNDNAPGAPQFPGDPAASVGLVNSKGIAMGYNFVVTPNLVSTFRYGFTRLSRESTGIQNASAVSFRNLADRNALTTGISRQIPLHQFSEDMSWTKGSHAVQFGTVLRFISNRSRNYGRSFNSATTNVSWLRGTGADLQPSNLASSDRTAYGDTMAALLGIVTQGTARYNYKIDGSVLPVGAPISRNFKNEEYELYAQDTWRVKRSLTVTYGLRWSLMPPIHEADGVQVSTNIPLGDWFNTRGALMDQGKSQMDAGLIKFLAVTDPNARPIYPYHKKNFAPRLSLAYSPQGGSALSRLLFGGAGKSSIRAGFGMYYDLIGQPLARTFDLTAFGFATTLVNPSGQLTTATAPRFTGIYSVPNQLLRAAPPGGFPVQFPASGTGSFAITNTIDDKLKPPYTMNLNFSMGREFGNGWFVQGAYVGRLSRRSLMNRDLAMPTNMTDSQSKQSYFEAATVLARQVNARVPTAQVQAVPFWENLFGNLKTSSLSATQVVYNAFRSYPNDWSSALADLDQFCDPACGKTPNMMMNPQFSALSAWSSIAGGNYHSMQWTLRKRFSQGLTMDFNYTLSKSSDLASAAENGGSFSGFLVNSWDPSQRRGVSDYDQRHIWSTWWVYELPFGQNKKFFGSMNRPLDYVFGGWQISGVWTQSTELPYSAGNARNWPTNWNITGFGTPIGATTVSTLTRNAPAVSGRGGPNIWSNPTATLAEWTFTLPGQSGSRNTVRGDGLSNWNIGLAKRIRMPYKEGHTVQLRAEAYNTFNQVRFGTPEISRST